MSFLKKAKDFYNTTILRHLFPALVVGGGIFGVVKYSNMTRYDDREIYIKAKYTQVQKDPESGKEYQAYIVEVSGGRKLECDGLYKPFTEASRKDAKARYDALELYHDYEVTTVKRRGMKQAAIVHMRDTEQKIHLTPFNSR